MYFVALVCPPGVNEKILGFKLWMKEYFGCVVALRSPAHITLVPPFWYQAQKENELIEVLQTFASDAEEMIIHINGFSHFGKRVLFAAVQNEPALQRLKIGVESHFINKFPNIRKEERPFHPHITIANRDLKPSDFDKAWQHFLKISFTDTFKTNGISILKYSDGSWRVFAETK